MPETQSLEDDLVSEIIECTHDPLAYALFAYPWGKGELEKSSGPYEWQAGVMRHISQHLQNPATRFTPCRIAVSSGHGIGKSALVGMILEWAMSTCEDCKGTITANTGTQLSTKTVPSVEKWFRLSINAHWWNCKATSITVLQEDHARLWRADYVPWSENNTEAFQGLHNKRRRIILVFDEASGIADAVWKAAEGSLTDEDTEIIWLVFGNPTKNTGRFRECFGSMAHRWKTFQIDARTVDGTNKEQFAEWLADFGEDSDWFRVKVRGEFPRAGSTQFIGGDVVAAARKYHAEAFAGLPKVLSVDVARFGDDQTIIGTRQGRKAVILAKYRGLDNVQVAERTIDWMQKEHPDGTVVDGDGLGAGVVDQIRVRGFGDKLFEFHGGASPNDPNKYGNKRAEVWGDMRDWLQNAEIPDDAELAEDLTSVEYGFTHKGQIQLEKKEDMKKRGLRSPDCGDMLAMTFATKLAPPKKMSAPPKPVSAWS